VIAGGHGLVGEQKREDVEHRDNIQEEKQEHHRRQCRGGCVTPKIKKNSTIGFITVSLKDLELKMSINIKFSNF
jgi:hypothetical protein